VNEAPPRSAGAVFVNERVLYSLTAIAVAAALGFGAFAWSRRVDISASERYGEQLRSLLALDARLSAEVMKAHSGIVAHYDGIVQTEAARKRLVRALRHVPPFVASEGQARLRAEIEDAERARREVERLVERFKREHAVLRNSLRFLPVLSKELDAYRDDDPSAQPIVEPATDLVRDELLLQTWQDAAILARVDSALAALDAIALRAPEPHRSALAMVAAHARVVRERTPVVRELTRQIVLLSANTPAHAISATFARYQQRAIATAESDRLLLFALSLFAFGAGAASIIARLRRSADRLRKTSAQLERAIESLRAEQAKQKELAELKSRFVSMASHEFRTPLSVIVSSSEMLEAYAARWPEQKKAEHFTRIRSAALGMTRMLDAILMIGRSDAGLLRFNPQPLEIGQFCGDVLSAIGDATGQRQRVVYRGPAGGERVLADETLLRHVLENLLGNALKYSQSGSSVELEVARQRGELMFRVIDRGIGISEEDQKHLFESFHRGTNVGSVSGTGLGLAIVRGATELHGGSISVHSEVGVGTSFTVRIPCVGGEA
jgi:signal transduction histidine kinase